MFLFNFFVTINFTTMSFAADREIRCKQKRFKYSLESNHC